MSILSEMCLELAKMYHAGNYEGCLDYIRSHLTPEILKNINLKSLDDKVEASDSVDELFSRRFGKDKTAGIWELISSMPDPTMEEDTEEEDDDEDDMSEFEDFFKPLIGEVSGSTVIDLNALLENGHSVSINITPNSFLMGE